MHDGYILGPQYSVDSLLLGSIQIGKVHGLKGEGLCLHALRIEEVAQIAQAPLATNGTIECVHHQAVAGLVERELHTQVVSTLQIDDRCLIRYSHHHSVTIDIAHYTRKPEILYAVVFFISCSLLCIESKEHHRPPELKVMLYIRIYRSADFHCQLIERIIIAPHETQGPPRVTAFHLPPYANMLCLLSVGFLFTLILQLQQ